MVLHWFDACEVSIFSIIVAVLERYPDYAGVRPDLYKAYSQHAG